MAIFGFGKRHKHEPGKYIVPPEMWDDPENAAFFARIGAKPDDPDNLRVTHDDVRRMIEEGKKAVAERIRQMKAKALAKGTTTCIRARYGCFTMIAGTANSANS